jgi:hypothetical protein
VNFEFDCKTKELLQEILEFCPSEVFLNITIALHGLPVSMTSGECSFSVLKQVKNYYHSYVGQDCLNGFSMLNINYDLAQKLNFSSIINAFSEK